MHVHAPVQGMGPTPPGPPVDISHRVNSDCYLCNVCDSPELIRTRGARVQQGVAHARPGSQRPRRAGRQHTSYLPNRFAPVCTLHGKDGTKTYRFRLFYPERSGLEPGLSKRVEGWAKVHTVVCT